MGVCCDLIRLSDQDVERCLATTDKEAIYAVVQHDRRDDWFEIDKAWHGIHFLLNRAASIETPLGFLLRGGKPLTEYNWEEICGVDVPDMRAFDGQQVKKISVAMSSVTERDFKRRYDPEIMIKHEIYPGAWEGRKNLAGWILAKYLKISPQLNYLVFHFNRLKIFMEGAANRHLGLVIKYHQ